jgi:hypothetical protein
MVNYYLAEQIAKDRLNEAREMARRARLMDGAHATPRPLRVALGLALIRGRSLPGGTSRQRQRPASARDRLGPSHGA